jgi:hypothetical protein
MSKIHKYQKFNPESFEARILDRESSQFYHEVLNKARKDFLKGHKYISNSINADEAEGSNFLFVCLADEILGSKKRIPTLNDWNDMLTGGNFAKGVYFDANQLVLRSSQASWQPNQHLINDLTRKLNGTSFKGAKFNEFTSQNPLVITGAKLRESKAKNKHYGLILNLDDATFEYDSRLAHGKNEIELGGQKKRLWTKENGVSWLCLGENDLYSNNEGLSNSNFNGRVAFIDAEGVQDFQKYLKVLEEEKTKQEKIFEERFRKAKNILKGKEI